jgi:hypothetical protein
MRTISRKAGMPRRILRREPRRAPSPILERTRLTIRWTVDQSVDPNLCALGRVVAIDITVSTTAGELVGQFRAPCLAFATSISALSAGEYVADAVLIDATGKACTTVIAIHPFAVLERSELVIDVDFPADSFLDSFDRETIRLVSDSGAPRAASAASDHPAPSGDGDQPHHPFSAFESRETR